MPVRFRCRSRESSKRLIGCDASRQRSVTIDATAAGLEAEAMELGREIERWKSRAGSRLRDLRGSTFASLHRSDLDRIERAEDALDTLRESVDELTIVEARLEAATSAADQLQQQIETMERRLESLIDNLDDCLPQGENEPGPPLSIPQHVDEFFSELWDLAFGPVEAIRELLQQAADTITLEGLAVMTGATSVSTEAVVNEALSGRHAERGPYWGGEPRHDQGLSCIGIRPSVYAAGGVVLTVAIGGLIWFAMTQSNGRSDLPPTATAANDSGDRGQR